MQIKQLLTDEDAVSPALGVALLIAITVILVAVVGAVVLGIGPNAGEAPNAQLEFQQLDDSADSIQAVHEGGDAIENSTIQVKVTGDLTNSKTDIGNMATGDQEIIATNAVTAGDRVRIVWESPSSDKTQLIGEYTVE